VSYLFNNLHVCNLRCIRRAELPVPSLWPDSDTMFVLRLCSTPALVFISVRLERSRIVFNNLVQGRDCLLVCLSLSFTPLIGHDSVNSPPVDYGLCCGMWHCGMQDTYSWRCGMYHPATELKGFAPFVISTPSSGRSTKQRSCQISSSHVVELSYLNGTKQSNHFNRMLLQKGVDAHRHR
jgi:hypothetical protein